MNWSGLIYTVMGTWFFVVVTRSCCTEQSSHSISSFSSFRNNNPAHGIGEISLTYMGNKEVDFNDFGGSQEVFHFGNCDGGDTNPTEPSPTDPPVENPTDPPVESPTDPPATTPTDDPVSSPTVSPGSPTGDYACASGESHIQMTLETDQWSGTENQLLFWDVAAPDNEWVWLVNLNEFEPNRVYDGNACLLLSH
jgi:hypothetical protein